MTDELKVDRGNMTHGQAKQFSRLIMQMSQPGLTIADLDDLTVKYEAIIRSVVVEVPGDWLPEGMTIADESWLDVIRQSQYDMIIDAILRPAMPGKKTV